MDMTIRMAGLLDTWKETDLDKFLLHHPLFGKLKVREILNSAVYRVVCHDEKAWEFTIQFKANRYNEEVIDISSR